MNEMRDPLTVVREHLASAMLILNKNSDQVRDSLKRHHALIDAARKVVNSLDEHKEWHDLKEAIGELAGHLPREVSCE